MGSIKNTEYKEPQWQRAKKIQDENKELCVRRKVVLQSITALFLDGDHMVRLLSLSWSLRSPHLLVCPTCVGYCLVCPHLCRRLLPSLPTLVQQATTQFAQLVWEEEAGPLVLLRHPTNIRATTAMILLLPLLTFYCNYYPQLPSYCQALCESHGCSAQCSHCQLKVA